MHVNSPHQRAKEHWRICNVSEFSESSASAHWAFYDHEVQHAFDVLRQAWEVGNHPANLSIDVKLDGLGGKTQNNPEIQTRQGTHSILNARIIDSVLGQLAAQANDHHKRYSDKVKLHREKETLHRQRQLRATLTPTSF